MANISPERFKKARELLGLTQTQMGNKIGITPKYLSMLERGDKDVDEGSSLGLLFRVIEEEAENPERSGFSGNHSVVENPKRLGFPGNEILDDDGDVMRRIPVIGWAHAGHAASYDEIPIDWQETVPTDCRDIKAFGVTLEGDSMEPLFRDGDLLVLMPSERVYNGCLAVVRLASDGVLLRRIELREQRIRLVPLNPKYEPEELTCEQVMWAYPVWGSWRQFWR